MDDEKPTKPIGRKNYGSIGHLPGSNLGPGDHTVNDGMARICKTGRGKGGQKYQIIVEEKYDGSNVGVAKVDGELVAMQRSGYPARSSPYRQHQWFATWVEQHADRFDAVLEDGERLAGEWLAVAHGTKYDVPDDPFVAFDIMPNGSHARLPRPEFDRRMAGGPLQAKRICHLDGQGREPDRAMVTLEAVHEPVLPTAHKPEGLVYRAERNGEVCFLAKYTREGFEHGKYLPGIGRPEEAEPVANPGVDVSEFAEGESE